MSHFPIVFQCYYTILVISLFFSKPLGGAWLLSAPGWALRAFAAERPGGQ